MAYDAIFTSASVYEINKELAGGKVEKVLQPEKDEIVLIIHSFRENRRLSICASSNTPRVNITTISKENPLSAPMFCMLLRKHLTGSKLLKARQIEFERVIEFEFECFDEMGYVTSKYLVAEIMGKYSNLVFLNNDRRIVGALKVVDLTTSSKRQVLPGMSYELPPKQDKLSPIDFDENELKIRYESQEIIKEKLDKFFLSNISGISALTAREMAYQCGSTTFESILSAVNSLTERINKQEFKPIIITSPNGDLIDYSAIDINQYEDNAICEELDGYGLLIDTFYKEKEKKNSIKQKGNDILHVLSNAESRIKKKIEIQSGELANCKEKDTLKLYGDLITANIYQLKRGMESASLMNYYSEDCSNITVPLDKQLPPAANAQRYYKKYNKLKKAESILAEQITLAKEELAYINTVFDSACRAENEEDLSQIREELSQSGYLSSQRGQNKNKKKNNKYSYMVFQTEDGKSIYVGKNNFQNDYISMKLGEKNDYWFHVKNAPGSHVLLKCNDEEPSNDELTLCCEIAAYYSSFNEMGQIPVDYLQVRYLKKPSGSKPGFVIYTTNNTAYVEYNEKKIKNLRIK